MWMCRRSLCLVKRWKSSLLMERRAEGGREEAHGGYGRGVAMAAAVGKARVTCLWGKREELLAEGVRVRIGEFTPKGTGEDVEPCEAKLPTEFRGWETGVVWGDALSAAVAVATPAWPPQRAQAFHVAAASGDETGG